MDVSEIIHPDFSRMIQSKEDKEDLLEYAKNPKGFLLLAGSYGSGKSYAAEAIYNMQTHYRLPDKDPEKAIFTTQSALYFEWLEDPKTAHVAIEKYRETKFLVIDDLGFTQPTESFLDFLYGIIDSRWRKRYEQGTVVTTNRNASEIKKILGAALLSRISSGILKRWEHADRREIRF